MTRQMIDEMILQRLIDGELSHQDRALFLKQIEDSPENWREIALALIEERAVQQELSTMTDLANNTVRIPKLQSSIDTHIDLPILVAPQLRNAEGKSRKFYSMPPLALVASLGLMALGFWGGSYLRGRSTESRGSISDLSQLNSPPIEAGKLQWVNGSQRLETPLYEASELDLKTVMGDTAEIERVTKAMERRGYRVDLQNEFYEGKLPDGRQIVVPVRNVNLRSIGQ